MIEVITKWIMSPNLGGVEENIVGDTKKKYSADELLQFAYKYNQIPVVLFAKDKECRYIYTSEVENLIDGGEDNSILGKTDMDIQFDPELGKLYYEQDKEIMRTGKYVRFYSEFEQDGKKIYREILKSPVYVDGEIIGVCGVASDVTELMTLKKKFETLSLWDSLTGVYNRNYFLEYDFNKSVFTPCSYIMCDCNGLKTVNDQMGHNAGDIYIRETAELLKAQLPSEGICVRWGGDEFLLIVPNYDEENTRKLVDRINEAQDSKRKELSYMEIAVGYYVREDLRCSETDAIQNADDAMYADKKKRKSAVWK